jgi:hypothetical protein
MATATLTDPFLRTLKTDKAQSEWADALVRGLRLRVTSKGTKTFSVYYRNAVGKQRRMTLGVYPSLGLAAARAAARDMLQQVAAGADPCEPTNDTLGASLQVLVDQHLAEWARRVKPETLRSTRSCWDRHLLPELGGMEPKQVTRRDVRRIVEALAAGPKPHASNFALGALSVFFRWCVDRDLIEISPCTGVRPMVPEVERDRVLSDAELRRIWVSAGEMGYPFGPVIRLLILTGQRRDEIGEMKRQELAHGDRIELSAERTKSGRRHDVPLTRLALAAR